MSEQQQFVALEGLAQGAVCERFSDEFQALIENITDPNTDPTAPRKLTITLTLKPTEQRNWANYAVQVKKTLVAHNATTGSFRIGFLGSRVEATEVHAEQPMIFSQTQSAEVAN